MNIKKRNIRMRSIKASEEVNVEVAPEASALLFEAEDVAEILSEVSGQDVVVEADENVVTFNVGDTEYTIEAEGDEEIVEAKTRMPKGRNIRKISASTRPAVRKPVRKISASTKMRRPAARKH